jgi:hypothetical protein
VNRSLEEAAETIRNTLGKNLKLNTRITPAAP